MACLEAAIQRGHIPSQSALGQAVRSSTDYAQVKGKSQVAKADWRLNWALQRLRDLQRRYPQNGHSFLPLTSIVNLQGGNHGDVLYVLTYCKACLRKDVATRYLWARWNPDTDSAEFKYPKAVLNVQ